MTGPIKPFGNPLAISEINTGFALGNDLAVYRGATWYYTANLVSGTFPTGSNANIDIAGFYGKQPTDPATGGTQSFNTVGSGSFTIPLYRNTLTIEIWGGGGGGGSGNHDGYYNGSNGTATTVLGVTAGGGNGGSGGSRYDNQSGAGGSGGTASGSATPSPTTLTKTNGNAGGGGNAGGNVGGSGGAAPSGGSGGAAGNQGGGGAGSAPGGGGGGGGYSDHQSKNPNQAAGGGGGSGAYARIYYSSYGAITSGTVVNFTIGAGGSGAPQTEKGGNGANGRITFTWT